MAITLKSIEKIFTMKRGVTHALKNISLTVSPGQIFGIIGRPKAGKTTLLRCINLLEQPTAGNIHVNGLSVTSLKGKTLRDLRKSIGMVFQHGQLLSSQTIYQNIALPLVLNQVQVRSDIEKTVWELLGLINLKEDAQCFPQGLSPSQKQKIEIARALANRPSILLCDDPTAGLDAKAAHGVLHLLRELKEALHFTLVLTTTDIEVVKTLCDEVVVLDQGRIVEQGMVFDIIANPKHDITKEFVKSATRLEMPMALRRRLRSQQNEDTHPVLRLSFLGVSMQEPTLAHIIRQYDLSLNIIQAHLETMINQTLGVMIVEMLGQKENVSQAIQFLEEQGLHVEVLGYVARAA